MVARHSLSLGSPTKMGKTIHEAFEELSTQAFACWVRMHVIEGNKLKKGRAEVAKLLGKSLSQSNAILRELRNCGYIRVNSATKRGNPSEILLEKRCVLVGIDHFIKMS
jgi:hypothetical protein